MTLVRPLVTMVVVAFNQEGVIRDAINGALDQTYEPLEIILSDDCSSDGTYYVMSEAVKNYSGVHNLRLSRTPHNLGLIGHLNFVMPMVTGDLVVIAAGDDVSLPRRVERVVDAYVGSGRRAMSIYSNGEVMGPSGAKERLFYERPPSPAGHDLERAVTSGFSILGAAHSWDVRVFSCFGPLPLDVRWEDWVIPFRAGLLGSIEYIDESLVMYRMHTEDHFAGREGHLATKARWYSYLRSRADAERAVCASYLSDLDRATHLMPSQAQRYCRLREAVQAASEWALVRHAILGGASRRERASWMLRVARLRTLPPREVLRWCLIVFTPRLYLRRLQTRAHAQRSGI